MVNIAITGANGRMGQAIARVATSIAHISVVAQVSRDNTFENIAISNNIDSIETVIDFTMPEPSLKYIDYCVQHKRSMVIGTTGFTQSQKEYILHASQNIPIVFAANMSTGVTVLSKAIRLIARTLPNNTEVNIIDAHHRHKKDAPSGTALQMGQVVAEARGQELGEDKAICFHSIRAGEIIGEHTVLFTLPDEQIELKETVYSREAFARGALQAALWVSKQPPGLYDMEDVLSLKTTHL